MTAEEQAWLLKTVKATYEKVCVLDWRLRRDALAAQERAANDRDLESNYGNFVVQRDPPRWKGASFIGKRLSECTPEYLDVLADFRLWKADREQERNTEESAKRVIYLRRDAARCRGWAAKIRASSSAPVARVNFAHPAALPQLKLQEATS